MASRSVTSKVSTAATAVVATMFSALLILLGLWLYESYKSSVRRTEERATAAAKIVATNASWINALAVQALQRIDDTLGPDLGYATDKVRDINLAVADLPGQVQAYVVDRNGLTLLSTDPKIKPINITDRPYFHALKNGAKSYLSGLLVSRLNGEQIFAFSRRLERNGEFAGVAVVSFEGKVLKDVWESVALGDNSTVSFIRKDGELIARYPAPEGPLDMSKYVLFADYLKKSPTGTYLATSPADGARRVVAYRVVEGTQFVALGSADYHVGMVPFRSDLFIAGAVLVLSGAGSVAAGGWIRHLVKRDAAKTASLEDAAARNALLLKEIHHRVKNNFQAVQSVIRLQQLPVETQKSLFDRIGAMIAVHERIYSRDQFETVSAKELVPSVVGKLLESYSDNISVGYDIDDIEIKADNATPVALLVNEVVTNSLKYAFADGLGYISVTMKQLSPKRASLVVTDDGIGFDASAARQGMGSRLIAGVVAQLHGTFQYRSEKGTIFSTEIDT